MLGKIISQVLESVPRIKLPGRLGGCEKVSWMALSELWLVRPERRDERYEFEDVEVMREAFSAM